MRRALVLRHHLEDHPGLVGEAFERRGFDVDVVMVNESTVTPSLDGYEVLVILGSKCAVYDREVEAAWFGRELALIGDADERGVAILGICFGAQALCRHFGGEVGPCATKGDRLVRRRRRGRRRSAARSLVRVPLRQLRTARVGRALGDLALAPCRRSRWGVTSACSSIPRSMKRN